jgi:hypothetical protein
VSFRLWFPESLLEELRTFLDSRTFNDNEDSEMNEGAWHLQSIKFVGSRRRSVELILQGEGKTLTVVLNASDYPIYVRIPNTGSYSNLALYISLLLDEQILGRPTDKLNGIEHLVLK